MVDLKILKAHGVSGDHFKKIFTSEKIAEKPARWLDRVRNRIQNGRDFCFSNYRLYYALDQANDCSFRQLSPTLAESVANHLSGDPASKDSEMLLKTAMEWGLTHLIADRYDPKTGKKLPGKSFNLPVFWRVIVPIAPAYMMIRVANQVNSRNRDPYLKYEPFRDTAEDRFRCKVITDWVRVMTKNYGYQHIGNMAILKAAMYGDQLMFPQDEWHEEKQLQYVNEKETAKIVREGIPYYFPHPSRTYWDRSYGASTLNTNTGSKWAGNWRVQRSGEVRNNPKVWNRERLKFPSQDLRSVFPSFFNTVYSSCALKFPQTSPRWADLNREANIEDNWYTTDWDDFAIVLTDHYEELIPSEWGLGDYDYPVWIRALMANDIDPIYVAPVPSIAPVYFGYSPDDSRLLGTSLLLELLWAQDHVSNLMSQTLLSVRQNLANLTFVNEDVVDENAIREIENLGESHFRKLNLFRYSAYKRRMGQDENKIESIQFPKHDVNQIIHVINALLGLLERVNVISAQEVGAQATHEQSAVEQRVISKSVSNKAAYFSFQIDKGFDAWKTQLYNYSMAYADEEVWAEIPSAEVLSRERLEKMGFTVDEDVSGDGKVIVRGKKSALALQAFASARLEDQRLEDGAMATAMVQLLGVALKEQIIAQSIGPHQAVKLFNQVLTKFGFPEDYRLNVEVDPQAEAAKQAEQFQGALQGLMGQVQNLVQENSKQVVEGIMGAMKPVSEAAATALRGAADNKSKIDQLFQLFSTASQMAPAMTMPAAQPQPMIANADVVPGPVIPVGNPADQGLAPVI